MPQHLNSPTQSAVPARRENALARVRRGWGGAQAALARSRALAVGACLIAILAPGYAFADCGRPQVTVVGSQDEEVEACAAIEEVIQYFAAERMTLDLRLTIRFQRTVFLEPASGASDATPISVSGFYHIAKNEIRMTSSDSEWTKQRRPWKLPWSRQLGQSILRHEIAHAVISQLLGENHHKLPRAWHEALAYAVQIDLMSPELRERILAEYPHRHALSSTLHINDFVYGADPDAFAIAAYKTYVRDGRLAFLKQALSLELDMIDLNDLP